jgi:hypothetical protein
LHSAAAHGGVDRQISLTERLSAAFDDRRHPSDIAHPMRELIAQRVFQIACADEDGNDANALRRDALFKLGLERKPLDATIRCACSSSPSVTSIAAQIREASAGCVGL